MRTSPEGTMTRQAGRDRVERILCKYHDRADGWIAVKYGHHRRTIRAARQRLVDAGVIPAHDRLIRRDGSLYPTRLGSTQQ